MQVGAIVSLPCKPQSTDQSILLFGSSGVMVCVASVSTMECDTVKQQLGAVQSAECTRDGEWCLVHAEVRSSLLTPYESTHTFIQNVVYQFQGLTTLTALTLDPPPVYVTGVSVFGAGLKDPNLSALVSSSLHFYRYAQVYILLRHLL